MCKLGKIGVILGIPQLVAYNPEIDWEKGEVKITRYPSIYGKRKQEVKEKVVKRIDKDKDKDVLKKLVPKRL